MYKRKLSSNDRTSKKARSVKGKKNDNRSVLRYITRRQLYPFQRFTFLEAVGGLDGTTIARSYSFKLNDVPNHTEFTALFDQYTIRRIKYRWALNRSPDYGGAVVSNVYNTTVQGIFPRIMWVHDYDGGAVPTNFADLQ